MIDLGDWNEPLNPLFEDEKYLEAEVLKEQGVYGIRFTDAVKQFVSVKNDEVTSAYYAEVKPFCMPDDVTDVFVITSFAGQGEGEIKE